MRVIDKHVAEIKNDRNRLAYRFCLMQGASGETVTDIANRSHLAQLAENFNDSEVAHAVNTNQRCAEIYLADAPADPVLAGLVQTFVEEATRVEYRGAPVKFVGVPEIRTVETEGIDGTDHAVVFSFPLRERTFFEQHFPRLK